MLPTLVPLPPTGLIESASSKDCSSPCQIMQASSFWLSRSPTGRTRRASFHPVSQSVKNKLWVPAMSGALFWEWGRQRRATQTSFLFYSHGTFIPEGERQKIKKKKKVQMYQMGVNTMHREKQKRLRRMECAGGVGKMLCHTGWPMFGKKWGGHLGKELSRHTE